MKTIHKKVTRKLQIAAGMPSKERTHTDLGYPAEGVPFQVAENMQDLYDLVPGKDQDAKHIAVVDLVNAARWAETRSDVSVRLAGTGRDSAISACKRMIRTVTSFNPDATPAEITHIVLGIPGMREKLESEGLSFQDVTGVPDPDPDDVEDNASGK